MSKPVKAINLRDKLNPKANMDKVGFDIGFFIV